LRRDQILMPSSPETVHSKRSDTVAKPAHEAGGHLRRRLLLWSLGIALVPMILLAAQGYHCAKSAVLDAATARLAQLTASRERQLELWFRERVADAGFLAGCPAVRHRCTTDSSQGDMDHGANALLGQFVARNGLYEAVGLYDLKWRELAGAGTDAHGIEDFDRSDIKLAVRTSTSGAAGRIHRHENGQLGMHFGAAVMRDGVITGYVLTALDESKLEDILSDVGAGLSNSRCYLVSSEGLLLTSSGLRDSGDALQAEIDTVGFRRAKGGGSGAALYSDANGREVVGGFTALSQMGWVLLLEQDAAEALAWLPELSSRAALTALVVALIVVLIVRVGARQLTTPLQQLVRVANRVGGGDHAARVVPLAQPEVDAVGRALNGMLDELSQARQRIVHSETLAAMGEMSSAVVHEMRNPLSSIKMNLQAIRSGLAAGSRHVELAEIAQEQVSRLERMFTDLLSLSRPLSMDYRVHRLRDVIVAALEAVENEAGELRCRIRVDDAHEGLELRIDSERIRQVLVNLFENAIAATGPNGQVDVAVLLDEEARMVALEVSDDGPGIPEDNRERLFQPFFTSREQGTGLGLAIVRKIVDYHGGRVSAANRVDDRGAVVGAVFRIELPNEPEPA
jgi:signal transduction histidine kinase